MLPAETGGVTLRTAGGDLSASKIVLAAGHGIPRLAGMVGLNVPTRPERGQVLVTARVQRFLPMPMSGVRQTIEGSNLIGSSDADVGFDDVPTLDIKHDLAARDGRPLPAWDRP